MATKDIRVIMNGEIYPCPVGWTVEKAERRIRSRYVLQGGELQHNANPVDEETDQIGSFAGALNFVGGQQGTLADAVSKLEQHYEFCDRFSLKFCLSR